MKKPKKAFTEEYRNWARKRFCIRRYLSETLGIPDYGKNGLTKKTDQEHRSYENLKKYAIDLLTNAILYSMPKDENPFKYCENIFGEPTVSSFPLKSKEEKELEEEDSPMYKVKKLIGNLSDEQREAMLKEIMED